MYLFYISMQEKLSNLEDENHILRQKALGATPRSNRAGFAKPFIDVSCNMLTYNV